MCKFEPHISFVVDCCGDVHVQGQLLYSPTKSTLLLCFHVGGRNKGGKAGSEGGRGRKGGRQEERVGGSV